MPKSQLDWLGVASLWLGAAIMAIKAADFPLLSGAPSWLAAHWWNYVPLILLSIYSAVAIYRTMKPRSQVIPMPPTELAAKAAEPRPEVDAAHARVERRADQTVIGALITAERRSREAIASGKIRTAEAEIPAMKAALLSAHKRFGTPVIAEYTDANLTLELGRRLIEKMLPFLEAGHIEEAQKEAADFLNRLLQANDAGTARA